MTRFPRLGMYLSKPAEPTLEITGDEEYWWWREYGGRVLVQTFAFAAASVAGGVGFGTLFVLLVRIANGAGATIPWGFRFSLWFSLGLWTLIPWNAMLTERKRAAIRSRRLRAAMTLDDADE